MLEVESLGQRGHFEDVSFAVRAGEIVGMFGLVGSGRTELAKAIFGARPADAGRVRLDGRDARFATPAEAVRQRRRHADRGPQGRRPGAGPERARQRRDWRASSASRGTGSSTAGGATALVDAKVDELSIRPRDTARPVRQLCGGNQQKVVLAKWLLVRGTELFIFDEPTRGVDIATRVEIYRMIRGLATAGAAVLLISSEMTEVLGLADRLLVMRAGRLAAELDPGSTEAEEVFALAAGLPVAARREAAP